LRKHRAELLAIAALSYLTSSRDIMHFLYKCDCCHVVCFWLLFSFQDESIARLVMKQSRLRVVDLGSNRFKTLPTALLKNSPHLSAVYLDDNRLSNCSQMHALRRAADLKFVDLSENRLTTLEKDCFDGMATGVTVKLAGNPFQCSCETAAVVHWLTDDRRPRLQVADRDSVTCSGPSHLAGTHMLQSGGSSTMPGSWECRWRRDAVVVVIALMGLTLFVAVLVVARRRFRLLRLGRNIASNSCQNGSISSVTISNSCYGNGSAVGPGCGSGASAPGSGYSPLIEDDLQPTATKQVRVLEPAASDDVRPCSVVDNNDTSVQRKQLSMPANNGDRTTSGGQLDNEALLASHVTEMEESV